MLCHNEYEKDDDDKSDGCCSGLTRTSAPETGKAKAQGTSFDGVNAKEPLTKKPKRSKQVPPSELTPRATGESKASAREQVRLTGHAGTFFWA